jgi:lipopolysaccharide heptosyltransferase II
MLVIRLSSLGDILLTTLLIRVLKQRFPLCQLDILTSSRYLELLSNNPHVHHLIAMDRGDGLSGIIATARELKGFKYDIVLDLHGSIRSVLTRSIIRATYTGRFNKHRFSRAALIAFKRNFYPGDRSMALWMMDSAGFLGVEDDGDGLDLYVDGDVESKVAADLESRCPEGDRHWVGLAPGARHFTKRWPIERWCELAKKLISRTEVNIMVLGDESEKQFGDEVVNAIGSRGWNIAGRFDMMESAAALSHCQAIITNDSGILHIAAARNVPVVAIFGPTVRAFGFYPFRVPYRIVERSLSCRPCSTKGSSRCPLKHFRCMLDITAQDVLVPYEDLMTCQTEAMKTS